MADKPILVGAVLYDPKVSVIWDIIRDFFEAQGCPIDVVFYTNYELQVDALVKGHIDIAWNSPLAWVDCVRQTGATCRAIAMRDTDRDRVSHLVVKADAGLASLGDLRGTTVALGAKDSPQATLIPTGLLQRAGLEPGQDFEVKRFDVLVGKHGDHVGGELEAFRSRDPLELTRRSLVEIHGMSEDDLEALDETIVEEMDAAVEFADASPQPPTATKRGTQTTRTDSAGVVRSDLGRAEVSSPIVSRPDAGS